VLIEALALAWLYFSVGHYRNFWVDKAREQGEITYLALGDSAAQGIGASSPMRGYVGLIAKRLEKETGKSVRVVNLSVTGARMSDYLRDQAPQITSYQPDFVTIEIGANDVKTYNEQTFRDEFKQVLATLPDRTYVSNMPLFNSRPGSTQPAKDASKVIEQELANYPKLTFVDLQKQTTENQSIFGFAPDLFHPNNLSYKNWADAFWLQIQKDL
jgi:lysophospholipase L1-like esterase